MIILVPILVVSSFCMGLFIGKSVVRRGQKLRNLSLLAHFDIVQAVVCRLALQDIRRQQIAQATEFLEHSLDHHISSLWYWRNKLQHPDPKCVDVTLNHLKAYRQKWPRQIGPDFSSLPSTERTGIASEAAEILTKVPPIPLPDIGTDSILADSFSAETSHSSPGQGQ
jgi:hypothetical protein